jgi:hypothetical protein
MAAAVSSNDAYQWDEFDSAAYQKKNYAKLQAVDREILRRVSLFFSTAFADRGPAREALDVGSGTNLYPALLMLPFTDRIMLTDFSVNNVRWLEHHIMDEDAPWSWQPFWDEVHTLEEYRERIGEPRKHLREACTAVPGIAGIEQRSVFDLPERRWQLGTMFFVAESITTDPGEFHTAVGCFVGALEPGAPFATAFMGGSKGYRVGRRKFPRVGRRKFPAVPITKADVNDLFTGLGAKDLSVWQTQAKEKIRRGYDTMIVATGIVGG